MATRSSSSAQWIGDALIAPSGLMLAVCDAASPFNRRSLNNDAWASTKLRTPDRLFEYNQFFCDEMTRGHGITWILMLWGAYRIALQFHESQLPSFDSRQPLIGNQTDATLHCPSGELVLIDVEAIDTAPPVPLAWIRPGSYKAALENRGCEGTHWSLTDVSQYPPRDGPEWVLHLAPA